MFRQQQLAMTPVRALHTSSLRSESKQARATEMLQSLLTSQLEGLRNSHLASSVAVMADKAAFQSAQQVRRLSAAATHLAAEAKERVDHLSASNRNMICEPTAADMLSAGLLVHQSVGSALEQASYQTNAIQFKSTR